MNNNTANVLSIELDLIIVDSSWTIFFDPQSVVF